MEATLERVEATQGVEVRDDRRLVLPSEIAEALGEFAPEDVLLFKTDQGILLTTRARLFDWALDGIGDIIRDSGETLDEWIEAGSEIREELVQEWYPKRADE